MFRGRYRWFIRLALVVLIIALGWMWAERERARHQLVVANRSGRTIGRLEIKVGDNSATFQDVASGSDVTAPFSVESNQHFDIRVEFGLVSKEHLYGTLGEERYVIVQPGGHIVFQGRRRQ